MNKVIVASRSSADSLECIERVLDSIGFVCEVKRHPVAAGLDCYTLAVHTDLGSFEEVAVEAINRVAAFIDSDAGDVDDEGVLLLEFGKAIPWMTVVDRGVEGFVRIAEALESAEPRILVSSGPKELAVPASQISRALRVIGALQ